MAKYVSKYSDIIKLVDRNGHNYCALTGLLVTPQTATLDHIVPIKDGGDSTPENLQLAIWWANEMKSTMSMEQFKERITILYEHLILGRVGSTGEKEAGSSDTPEQGGYTLESMD